MFSKYRILIYSENPDKLMEFYRDVLEFKLENKLTYKDDYGYMFNVVGDLNVWIGKHDEIKGNARESFRHLFNLYPDEGVSHWYEKIKDKKRSDHSCQTV